MSIITNEMKKRFQVKKENLQVFENDELHLQMRAIKNDDGSISVNVEDTAIGFGWYQKKNGVIYPKWERINSFINDIGVSPQVGKGDYIPESLFYRLGMKANNKVAQDFQNWLAIKVIPQIRKTGSYSKPLSPIQQLQLQSQAILEVNDKINDVQIEVNGLKDSMPLFSVECKDLQALVKKIAIQVLGGDKNKPAYKNKSVRSKVFSDIQCQLRRQFGVKRYEGIKRKDLDTAKNIVEQYQLPFCLEQEVDLANNQISVSSGGQAYGA